MFPTLETSQNVAKDTPDDNSNGHQNPEHFQKSQSDRWLDQNVGCIIRWYLPSDFDLRNQSCFIEIFHVDGSATKVGLVQIIEQARA